MILDLFQEKSALKKEVNKITEDVFSVFQKVLKEIKEEYSGDLKKLNTNLRFEHTKKGEFESKLSFAGDILFFTMHTNVFNFDDNHYVHTTEYVGEDDSRSYCGMIQIYNFLYDSVRYNRRDDLGYLIGRVVVNKERHFFVEGKRQLGFLYNDFDNAVINEVFVRAIIESANIYSIDFDLLATPYDEVKEITLQQKQTQFANSSHRTGKRLGFRFQADSDKVSD
jgi:hypothetical protein